MNRNRELENRTSKRVRKSQGSSEDSSFVQADQNEYPEELELFKYAIKYVGDPMFWTDGSARIAYANNATCKLLGYSKEELSRMTVHDIDIDFPEKQWPMSFSILKDNKVMTIESRYRCKDGKVIPVEITGNYLEFKGKEYNYVTFRDLTEHKRLEEELRKSEHRYRSIYLKAADGITLIDSENGYIVDCNAGFERLTGRKLKELKEMKIWDLRPPDQIETAKRKFYQVRKTGHGSSRELDFQKPDGEIVNIGCVTSKIEIENVKYLQSVVRDITSQKRLELALEESEKKYRTLFNNATDAFVLWEYQGEGKPFRILEANTAACVLFEYNYKELIGKTGEDVNTPESLSGASAVMADLLGKGHATYELTHLSKSGRQIPTEVSGHYFTIDGKRVILSIIRDISKRKESDRKLQQLYKKEEKLRHDLQKEMNRRIQFTRALVHELRTPLTPLLGMSSMLVKRLEDPQNIKMANCIRDAGIKLNKRIGELLDMAKGELGLLDLRYHWLNTGEVLNDISDSISIQAKENGYILVNEISPSLPTILADEDRFRQVVLNLVNNSFKYTKPGTMITIGASADNEQITVFVQDNGPGIPKGQLKRIFKPYQQLEDDRGRLDGLGLGLSLSKQLVELHGGKIWAESKKGKGAKFIFTIPLQYSW